MCVLPNAGRTDLGGEKKKALAQGSPETKPVLNNCFE